MTKKLALLAFTMLFTIAMNALTIRYYNKDSKNYEFKVKMNGSSSTVEFDASKTSSVSIQGSGTAIIIDGCGKEIKVKDGDKITIKDGCITID